jgi:hypothetical protein
MRTTIRLEGLEEKTSKSGSKYHSFKTDQGNMSCFEEEVVKKLASNILQYVVVEVVESKGFKNIREFYEVGVQPVNMPAPTVEKITPSLPVELKASSEEPKFRINIKKSAKDKHYYDITIRSMNITDARESLNEAIKLAKEQCAVLDEQCKGSGFGEEVSL